MLAELRTKSQITIPKSIVTSLGLNEGDQLEVYEQDGVICLCPVAVYPKRYVEGLQDEIAELRRNLSNGTQPVYSDVTSLIDALEAD
ncbi:MAG: AbrB/MazE/SpoVT family DNA-binding domain-containing protein [Clostridia bacterium]|nr:AbrB/MazE/SpoVT family DNA-binding domain-containing protein [Clostridia bacterium]